MQDVVEETNTDLRNVQLACLNILKEFRTICEKNSLRYYLAYGTLLGTIRHHGYIPWDDDIDIWMPRPDFERFLSIASQAFKAPYVVNYFSLDNNAAFKYRTQLCIEDHNYRVGFDLGGEIKPGYIWIDIIPMDGMPSGRLAQKLQCLRFSYWYMKIGFVRSSTIGASNIQSKSMFKRLGIWLNGRFGIGKRMDIKQCFQKFKRTKMRYVFDDCGYIHGSTSYYTQKAIFQRSLFEGERKAMFEGELFSIPKGTEEVLTSIYGNYMTPPPISKRGRSHFMVLNISNMEN